MGINDLLRVIRHALTRRQRRVCARYWFDGHKQADIGRDYGMSIYAVSMMVIRATRRLKAEGVEIPPLPPHRRRIQRQLPQLSNIQMAA